MSVVVVASFYSLVYRSPALFPSEITVFFLYTIPVVRLPVMPRGIYEYQFFDSFRNKYAKRPAGESLRVKPSS